MDTTNKSEVVAVFLAFLLWLGLGRVEGHDKIDCRMGDMDSRTEDEGVDWGRFEVGERNSDQRSGERSCCRSHGRDTVGLSG